MSFPSAVSDTKPHASVISRSLRRTGHCFLALAGSAMIPACLIKRVPWYMPVGPALAALTYYAASRILKNDDGPDVRQ